METMERRYSICKIEGNPTVVEGGKLSHTVTLVDKMEKL